MYQQLKRVLHVMQELILSPIEMLMTTCQQKQVLIASHQLSVGDDISTNEMPYIHYPLQLLLLRLLLQNFDSIYPVQKSSELLAVHSIVKAKGDASSTKLQTFVKAKDKPTFDANKIMVCFLVRS
jgi:hypothetical protein